MMDMTALKQRIKDTVTMDDVLRSVQITLPADRKITSIYRPEERTPSLHVYDQDFYCYASGNGGDVIRFTMDYLGVGYGKAVRWLAGMGDELARPIRDARGSDRKISKDLTKLFEMEPEAPPNGWQREAAEDLFKKWPVDLDWVTWRFNVKLTRRAIWVPHIQPGGKIYGIRVRRYEDGKKLSVKGSTFGRGLYREPGTAISGGFPVVLVEGESDTWSLTRKLEEVQGRSRPLVFGLPTGAPTWNDTYRDQLLQFGAVYLALDSDGAGSAAAQKITQSLLDKPLEGGVYLLHVPGGRVAEAIAGGWVPEL